MSTRLGDIIRFRDDKLFQGAVDVSWFSRDRARAEAAAAAFVFHGPRYHGVRQQEGHFEHKLTDTATFAHSILEQACGKGDQPFKMAVAGYGTGKSHLALALAELLHAPQSAAGRAVLAAIASADEGLGQECRILLNEQTKPSLVIALNGMSEFPLMSETMRRVTEALRADGHDSAPIENVRPRFAKAASLIEKLNSKLTDEICREAGKPDLESLTSALREEQDEAVYKAVAHYLMNEGVSLDASQNGSLQDLFQTLADAYCGEGKPYKNVVILFDEFGKYLEFAIGKPYIAGTSALQELFEAVQGCGKLVCFVGFIQFELKSYLQRLNAEYRNEAQRYITRYDNAEKVYLSTNLETLIAHLIEKRDKVFLKQRFSGAAAQDVETAHYYLRHFFPASQHSATWQDPELFARVICQGCWPLSPFALWFIFSLASGSRFLQGRSALSLLKELFASLGDSPISELPHDGICASALLTPGLREELTTSEKSGNQGAIAHALESVLNRHRERLEETSVTLLKAIVVAAKLIMKADNRDDAMQGLARLSGLAPDIVQKELHSLQFELNLIEWDEALCCFDILGDAIPKTQFISFLNQRRRNEYDSQRQEKLFASSIDKLTGLLAADVETNFGDLHHIKTREWRFTPQKTNLNFIAPVLNEVLATWPQRTAHDEAKGSVIFCYAGPDTALEEVMNSLRKDLQAGLKQRNMAIAPLFIILLHDADAQLGTILAEYDILQHLDEAEKSKFANLVSSHEESLRKHAERIVHQLIKERHWIAPLRDELPQRLSSVGLLLFERIYKEAVPFSMDGFATAHGNGPTTAYSFARKLFHGTLTFDDVQSMNTMEKNRAVTLLKNDWNIFSPSGSIQKNPAPLQRIFRQWDTGCREGGMPLASMYSKLTQPPFGMNAMAALLAMGVYVSARLASLHVNDGESVHSIRDWAASLLSGGAKKITPQLFGAARLFPSEESSSKWAEFFDEWSTCSLYQELCEFPARAKELRKQNPISPEDMNQYIDLQEKSSLAEKELQNFTALEDKAEGQLEEAEKKGRLDLYLYSTANFGKLLAAVERAPECWPAEHAPRLERRFGQMRQRLAAAFPEWLETLAPRSDTLDAIAQFKATMDAYRKKLLSIQLDAEAEQVSKATTKACHNIETIARYREKMQRVGDWLKENQTDLPTLSFVRLRASLDTAKDHAKSLGIIARNKPLEGLATLRETLSEHQKHLETRLKNLQRELSQASSASPRTIEETSTLLEGLNRLEQIFSQSSDAADITDLKNTLSWMLSAWKTLRGDLSLDAAALGNRLTHFKEELAERIKEKELGLSAEDLYAMTAADIDAYRKDQSAHWLASARAKCSRLSSLSLDEATALLHHLRSAPAYLTDQDGAELERMRRSVRAHLEQQKIDWLIQEFNALAKEQQKMLLERLNNAFSH